MSTLIRNTTYLIAFSIFLGLFLASQKAVACTDSTAPCEPTSHNSIELPIKAIQNLKIDAGFGWGIFSGSIYNGNNEYTITQLIISMKPIHDHHTATMMHDTHPSSHEYRSHQIDMNLKPLTKGALSMALDDDVAHVHNFEWKVLKAHGYITR